jgi:hypothetical protein
MRRRRWIGAATIVGMTLAGPTVASADGGAYLVLERTHYLPGQTARAEGYVSVPATKQDLFDRGPFYLYVVAKRSSVVEGRPIPDGAVRVATISIKEERGTSFELHASFAVPDLAGDSYGIAVCNDPCTIAGFREPLTGEISIVATAREGELLTELYREQNRTWMLRRQVRKAEHATDEAEAQLLDAEVARSALAIDLRELRAIEAQPTPTSDRRPMIPAWGAVTLTLGLLVVAVAIVTRSRRRFEPVMLDPIEEPERERELVSR